MLAGRVPFESDSTLSVIYMHINEPPPAIPGITPEVQDVIDRALKKNPDERYQSSRDMAVDFFLAIGMTAEAETIIGVLPKDRPAPERTTPENTNTVVPAASAPQPKPAKKTVWIGAAILSFICLLGLALGAFRLLSGLPNKSSSTETPAVPTAVTESITSAPENTELPSANAMVEVSADTYEIGVSTPVDEFHIAPTSIALQTFWIDKYQTTNEQYQQYINETGSQPPTFWPGNSLKQPVRGVTWDQASAYCAWAHKRLPKEAEWEAAGRGGGPAPFEYPWGNDYNQASNLPVDDTYDVGTQAFNVSPFGVFDLVGNVWEWVDEPYSSVQAGLHILRGGRFGNAQDLAYRVAAASEDPVYIKFAGFRCAADQVK